MSIIMAADDPRHGTEAGHEQHLRDGHNPCHSCHQAKLKAARRRSKRKAQGFIYTMPAGMAHHRIQHWMGGGATQEDVARHTSLETSVIHRLVHGTPEQIIYPRTWHAIMSAATEGPLTSIGATRRVRALTALGYSLPAIARETGIHHDTILDTRAADQRIVQVRVREAIAAAYQRLEMSIPIGATQQERAGITRAKNMARRRGWPPPIVWDAIDDSREQPKGWEYVGSDRHAELDDLLDRGVGVSEAARVLGITVKALEKWMDRHGRRADYNRLTMRERGAA